MATSRRSRRSRPEALVPKKQEKPMSKDQATELMFIAANFVEAINELPKDKQDDYLNEQSEVADTRKRAEVSGELLHLRVK
jgi:hypothetical protein